MIGYVCRYSVHYQIVRMYVRYVYSNCQLIEDAIISPPGCEKGPEKGKGKLINKISQLHRSSTGLAIYRT